MISIFPRRPMPLPPVPPVPGERGGFALPSALAVLVLLSVLVVTVYANSMASFRSGTTDMGKSRSHFAAEAGAESGMAQLADALEDAVLEDAELTMITAPVMAGFTFDSFSTVKVGGVVPELITDGPFAGLYSLTQMVDIYSEASDPAGNSSAVMVTAKAQAIPIFQFGIFYEKDLEIHNGPRLDFAGWVHTNGNLYLMSANQYFQDLITTPNKVYHDRKDSHDNLTGTWIQDATATDVRLTFDSRSEPDPNDFRAESDADFDNRLQTDAYNVDSLRVPLPVGMDPYAVIEPRLVADGPLEVQAKMAWKADWYITVPNNVANTADFCATLAANSVRDAGLTLPNATQCANIFQVTFDAFADRRENKYVDVFNINMGQLRAWVGTNATRRTEIIYVHFQGPGGPVGTDVRGDGYYHAVRVSNAAQLPNRISVATKHPMYVMGNYNTVAWVPSALMGDNITLLSSVWNDAQHQPGGTVNAANTAYYMAVLAGHSPTPWDHEDGGGNAPYGGGLENFPRFLENWGGGRVATYRGSLVSLYFAQQSTGTWGGSYYSPPSRDWAFDTRFEDPANLPPGTPVVGNVIHTAFRPVR